MNEWVIVSIVAIVAATLYSYHKQFSYAIVASTVCVVLFIMVVAVGGLRSYDSSATYIEMAFMPGDLIDPSHFYTILTSMFTHADMGHIFWNVLCLAFLGTAFEQRIGARPFIVMYFLTGVCGTLFFAALRWDDLVLVVGASGAISGILGAYARLFPNERMVFLFFPFGPIPIWVVVGIFLLIQIFVALGDTNIAVEAHVGGLIAGMAIAPYVVRMPLHRRVKRMISLSGLRRLAKTQELKAIMRRIEDEEIPDVRSAWIEEFLSKAKCPQCGARIRITKEAIMCERGHML